MVKGLLARDLTGFCQCFWGEELAATQTAITLSVLLGGTMCHCEMHAWAVQDIPILTFTPSLKCANKHGLRLQCHSLLIDGTKKKCGKQRPIFSAWKNAQQMRQNVWLTTRKAQRSLVRGSVHTVLSSVRQDL